LSRGDVLKNAVGQKNTGNHGFIGKQLSVAAFEQ